MPFAKQLDVLKGFCHGHTKLVKNLPYIYQK